MLRIVLFLGWLCAALASPAGAAPATTQPSLINMLTANCPSPRAIIGSASTPVCSNVALTNPGSLSTLTLGSGKTVTISNTLTLTATDGATLAIGGGGTLGSNAYTSTAYAPINNPTFTGTVTIPSGAALGTPTTLVLTSATGLPNAGLLNSTISGVALGGTLGTLTFGTHLAAGGSSYNGSAGVTITSDATNSNTASTIVARDASGNFSGGTITALTAFVGNLTGLATAATNAVITDDTTTNAAMNLTWVTSNTGNLPLKVTSTKLTFNPSTGALSSTSFTGAGTGLTGTAASLTAGNVTTNANLTGAITSVGNATSLGSFTSANLSGALTDETGSGAAVFGTSPILSTVDARGTWTTGTSWTLPAHTLGGTVSGGGNQINNVIIGTSTPLAGSFTALTVTSSASFNVPANNGIVVTSSGNIETSMSWNASNGGYFQINDASFTQSLLFLGVGTSSIRNSLVVGGTTGYTLSDKEFGMAKMTASGTAPGAGFAKLSVVAGTTGGTCKLIIYAGTSTTSSVILDNIGSGC